MILGEFIHATILLKNTIFNQLLKRASISATDQIRVVTDPDVAMLQVVNQILVGLLRGIDS